MEELMHPLTRFFNYLKRIEFSLAVKREHLSERQQVEWYPVWMYELMETDENRNQPYRDTIQEVVAGKVVLELGTGRKALWAVCCAKAGAKQVYAIEANRQSYEASLRFLDANKIDKVRLIHGFSDKVELPERCEVLVHDLIGNIASAEGMIPFIEDAKRRLLTPDAVHIPQRCVTCAVLAQGPTLTVAERAFSYVLRGFQRLDRLPFVRVFGFQPQDALSEPYVFEDFTLRQEQELQRNVRLDMEIKRDGVLQGVFFFLRIFFNDTRLLDTWASHTCWEQPFVRFQQPTRVKKGDRAQLCIQSDLSGTPRYSLQLAHQVNGSAQPIGEYVWAGD
jgi:protein arginine N-methyltransferase 1